MSGIGLGFEIWNLKVPLFKELTLYWTKQISKHILAQPCDKFVQSAIMTENCRRGGTGAPYKEGDI